MRKIIVTMTVAALVSWVGTPAQSQTPPQQQLAPIARINLTLEQRHVIKEIIKEMKIAATSVDSDASVGEKVPQATSPRPMPTDIGQKVPQVKAHTFFVTEKQIVIVDPKDNTVAEVIELND